MKGKTNQRSFFARYGAALLLAAALIAVYYFAAHRMTFVESDYAQHGKWAMVMTKKAMIASFYNGSERLWHLIVRFTFDHLIHDLYMVTALVTAVVDAAAYLLVFAAFEQAVSEKMPRWLLAAVMLVPFIATALTLPGGALYAGAGGLNTWHNPTNIMVRPFAAAVFFMTVRIYNRRRSGRHALLGGEPGGFAFRGGFWAQFREPVYTPAELVFYPLCLLLSVYSKPSFLQFFAPAIFLFLLIDVIRTKGMLLPFCIKLALSYIPAAVILFMAIKGFFPSGASVTAETAEAAETAGAAASGIAVYFIKPSFAGPGDLLRSFAGELAFLVRPCAFPILMLVLSLGKPEHRPMARLAALGVIAAFAETLILHETGYRAEHGNFLWGMYLASWLAWVAAAGQYADLVTEGTKRSRAALYAGTPLMVWHLACGIAYLVVILRTGVYYL